MVHDSSCYTLDADHLGLEVAAANVLSQALARQMSKELFLHAGTPM